MPDPSFTGCSSGSELYKDVLNFYGNAMRFCPKLISGEIRVRNAEKVVEGVA